MEYSIKKSNQLTVSEKLEICALFNRVFNKTMTQEEFHKKYEGTVSGYSFHGIMIDKDKIVGCDTSIPFKYRYFDADTVFALSVDTMIDEFHRGNPFNLKKMTDLVYDALRKENISFVFGFPNDKVYLVRKRLLKWEDIGELDYYVLPVTMRALTMRYSILNFISRANARFISYFSDAITKLRPPDYISTAVKYGIHKTVDDHFMEYRYGREGVKTIQIDDECMSVYKIDNEGDVKVAYIIDIVPLSKALLEVTVNHIYHQEKMNIDIIMYIGRLTFKPINLYRVPKRFQPRVIHMSGKILLDGMVDSRVYNINNWAVNLSNLDVR